MWQKLSLHGRINLLLALVLTLGLAINVARLVLEAGPRVQAEDQSVISNNACTASFFALARKSPYQILGRKASRSGNVWDNAAMESFFSSLKTERTARRMYRTRDDAKADVFDYIERFYNPKRRHSTIGYLSPMEFERQAGLA